MYLTPFLLALSIIPPAYAGFQIITAQPLPTLALPPLFQNDAEVRLFPCHLYHFPSHLPSVLRYSLSSTISFPFLHPFPSPVLAHTHQQSSSWHALKAQEMQSRLRTIPGYNPSQLSSLSAQLNDFLATATYSIPSIVKATDSAQDTAFTTAPEW